MIAQEVIPGGDSCLVYAPFYVDHNGTLMGYFSGRKHRVIPTGFGSASFVETFQDDRLRHLVARTLAAVGYRGLGGLEFKEDPRDGQYKLIEFNTRFGMWDGLGLHAGVDLAYLSYLDAIRSPIEPHLSFRSGVKWIDWQRDLRAFVDYRRRGHLTFGEWRRSLHGPRVCAVYSRLDRKPGLAFSFDLAKKLGRRAWRLISRNTDAADERP
jgi:predicted ATP-grasp superfamily ATP-dependent carboligase